jgi:hypothetical protein
MDDVDAALATLRDRIAELEAQTSVGSAGPSDPPPTGTGIPFAPEPGNG